MTYTGLLLNFKSFTSFSYKISLIKCLIDRSFKICNNWNSFHNDIESIKSNLIKNAYPPFLINNVIKKYLNYKFSSNQNQLKDISDVHYFKLPYIRNLLHHIKNKFWKLCKGFCKENFNINLLFASLKIKMIFLIKTQFLKSFLVYEFTCASCSSSYIGLTCCHFKTRIQEHKKKHNKSHILRHLHYTATCFNLYNFPSFKIIGKDNFKFELKIKKSLHINWRNSSLNTEQNHLALTLSVQFFPLVLFCLFFFFCVSLYLLFSLSLKLIIGIFNCFNYTSLLLHLITTHVVSDLFLTYYFHYFYANYQHFLLS